MPVQERVHRLARAATLAVVAVLMALPVLLGPAMPVAVKLLADVAVEHHCACGMKAGKCGCPECEELARPGDRGGEPTVTRFTCDDARFVKGAVPPMIVPPAAAAPSTPVVRSARLLVVERAPTSERLEPPEPPPRAA